MADTARLGPWVRRFLLEHLIGERNLSLNTQRSYRDTLALLIPFAARQGHKKVDELTVSDVSEKCVAGYYKGLDGPRFPGHNEYLRRSRSRDESQSPRTLRG